MRKFLNEDILTEISLETVKNAADKQEKLLNNSGYLKKISAWQYLRCIKRLEDFKKYAEAMVAAINAGNTGTPDDPEVSVDVVDKTAEIVRNNDTGSASSSDSTTDETPVTVNIPVATKPETQTVNSPVEKKKAEAIIPKIPGAAKIRPGKYIITYKTLEDDLAHEWTEARSINGAIRNVLKDLWDIKEILTVEYDDGTSQSAKTEANKIIDIDNHDNYGTLGKEVASVMTDGQFDSMRDLIGDAHDDKTTIKCQDGFDYVGEDVHGIEWEGPKSSYTKIYKERESEYENNDNNRDITIVTRINESGDNDETTTGVFNVKAFKRALRAGIVHFNYTKMTDGTERQAFGTTNQQILEDNHATGIPGNIRGNRDHLVTYYDMTQKSWRSCAITSINTIYDEFYVEVSE